MIRKPYKTKPRPSQKDIKEAHELRYSLDDRWIGMTNKEKEEVLTIFEKVNKKRMKKLEDDS